VPPRTRTMMKSKIHRATVTDANLNYVGSITVDTDLLEAADILPYEQVFVLNINTGARFETYAIEGPAGKGDICLNGAAARLAQPGRPGDRAHLRPVRGGRGPRLRADRRACGRVEPPGRGRGAGRRAGALGAGMSTAPTAADLRARKGGARLVMLTAYDYPTALALDACGLDILLVGDSPRGGRARVRQHAGGLAGDDGSPRPARCATGTTATHVCGDLTAGTYRTPEEAVASARVLVEAGADSVKLEGGLVAQVAAIIADGIPVMGHVGLLPQTAAVYRREGTHAPRRPTGSPPRPARWTRPGASRS
jgi:hypothetical protein